MQISLKDVEETKVFGIKLGKLLRPGDVICLNGDLGAGKTTLTKSIGEGMGIEDYITSPTFTIINEYYGPVNLYHFDTYRLETEEDIFYMGFDEYFYGDGVCIVEWADKIKEALPEDYLELNIKRKTGEERIIDIVAVGLRSQELLEELK
ncbi:tRNA (adenosine(37)-N6)-threonylcarbamoyltransferase complex ATPase subunit type 1 TsaE [Anaerosphaera multitolerans]|uniref:tRNA threonylcarbamoyladenosine biosynthesis protein TsaE n=1 Tax=Anaerosphaera multitolerans TaxID=2487351 RepID=A0A437S803_9FIRM|nr:tRNA (adenosine(37)-N6)-threonylcarbamoyltransferase complex ATPase subunit type 1 TsaE [Anaerosphaera multitolerans]RVU55054.1 tRNA (adenosine(37)-N6)-threonylcarbamoyltransferase complex ATPase subunit type 1 TsaE [Anaerosphaera multitolerans]